MGDDHDVVPQAVPDRSGRTDPPRRTAIVRVVGVLGVHVAEQRAICRTTCPHGDGSVSQRETLEASIHP